MSLTDVSAQETYKSHKVEKGETVFSIAKQYGISEETIYRLNPDARLGIKENSILIIPTSASELEVTGYSNHRVKRKETLFSISQQYGVSVDDLKKSNKFLYSRELEKGDKLRIPKYSKPVVVIDDQKNPPIEDGGKVRLHEVQPQETLYGIARKYGTTIAELKTLNPDLSDSLPVGKELKVPATIVSESSTIEEDKFDFYEVQPKEGFYRLKVKLGLTEEEIVALNPYAKDGLKEGMILKIPKTATVANIGNADKVDLSKAITNRATKNIAVMLPFQLKNMVPDSSETNAVQLQKNRTMRIALDFYSGVLMATEFAKEKGISINLKVFDTEGSESTLDRILRSEDLTDLDAVVGPLISKNVEKAASYFKENDIPVISPLSNRNIKLTSNLFQTLPDDQTLRDAMIQYLRENSQGKQVFLIADSKSKSKAAIMEAIPSVHVIAPREGGYLYVADLQSKLLKNTGNWVILETTNPLTVSNVIGVLNGLPSDYQIQLFTTDKNDSFDYDDISNVHLAKLQFTFPSVSKNYKNGEQDAFLVSYKQEYGVFPNRFAVRGFDVMYDILLRLASSDSLYDSVDEETVTEYIENKFRYEKKLFSGYTNQAFYILKYGQDLNFEIVK